MYYAKLAFALIFSASICLLGYLYVRPALPPGVNYSIFGDIAYGRVIILFSSMLLGILAHSIHAEISNHSGSSRRKAKTIMRRVLRSTGLLTALCVSPIIFFSTYQAAGQQPDGVIAFCLAFQNGFFWKTIFAGAEKNNTQEVLHD